jgi:hypothetical protein
MVWSSLKPVCHPRRGELWRSAPMFPRRNLGGYGAARDLDQDTEVFSAQFGFSWPLGLDRGGDVGVIARIDRKIPLRSGGRAD